MSTTVTNISIILYILSWFIMMRKHKYQNYIKLISISTLSLILIYNFVLGKTPTFNTVMHCLGVYASGVILEYILDKKNSLIFTRKNKIKVLYYDELKNEQEFTIDDKLKNTLKEKNGVSMTFQVDCLTDEATELYTADYDVVLLVIKGKLQITKPDKTVVLNESESYKIGQYVPRKLQGTKGTLLTAILINR